LRRVNSPPLRVEVHPFLDDDEYAYCTTVIAPGAFVLGGHSCAVKVRGDAFAIEGVFPIIGDLA
jgi:hypothetical protein